MDKKKLQFSFQLIFDATKKYQKDKNELLGMDSDHDKQVQSLLSYR